MRRNQQGVYTEEGVVVLMEIGSPNLSKELEGTISEEAEIAKDYVGRSKGA